MVISRTPFRISFFGGGTDYPIWYREHGGAVLSTTINRYCYLTCRYLPPFFDHKTRLVWSKVEMVQTPDEIEHPAAREIIKFLAEKNGLQIHHDGDLPARAGLGSSSAFTVGLLHSLYALQGKMVPKQKLALDAMHVEQELIRENVGSQDQVAAAFGGLNVIEFGGTSHVNVHPVLISQESRKKFQDHLMLFFTGFSRNASDIAARQIELTPTKTRELTEMQAMVPQAAALLARADFEGFGNMLHESWDIKRTLSPHISNPIIDEIYEAARKAGAYGGKLMGAGGGGFMVFLVDPERQPTVKRALSKFLYVPVELDNDGSQIIYYAPMPQPQTKTQIS